MPTTISYLISHLSLSPVLSKIGTAQNKTKPTVWIIYYGLSPYHSTKLCESLKLTFIVVASKTPSYMVHEQNSYLFMPTVDTLFATHLPPNYTATLLDLSLLENLFFCIFTYRVQGTTYKNYFDTIAKKKKHIDDTSNYQIPDLDKPAVFEGYHAKAVHVCFTIYNVASFPISWG